MRLTITWSSFVAVGFGAFLFSAAIRLGVSAPQSEPNQRLCAIKGVVTDAVTSEGLRKAFVRLVGKVGKGGSYPAVTDDHGGFSLENIEPGTYVLTAEHQGFIEAQFGEADGSAVEMRLTPGQALANINIKLTPQSVISGRVVDEEGDVWTHADVNLFRSVWAHGKRTLQGFAGGEVNDQGEFRIGQIPPGKYYLSAEPDAGWESRNQPRAKDAASQRQPTWYPSSLDPEGATSITLGPGNQLSGMEIRLRRGSTHLIRGRLLGSENIPEIEESVPYGRRGVSAISTSGVAPNAKNGVIHSDGSFEITRVASGPYELHVHQGFPPINIGRLKIQVEDRDLDDVSIQLNPPRPLSGVIQVEEEGSIKSSGLTVRLDALTPSWNPSTVSRADGSFDFRLVGSERYRVIVGGYAGNGFYLKQIRYGDVVSKDGTVSVTGAGGSLVLVLSTRGARLVGKVSTAGTDQTRRPVGTPQVVLMPDDALAEARLATFDQTGTFSFGDLAPGTYKVYAFEGVPEGAWDDSDFMKEISGKGIEIRLAEGETKDADIPLLLKSDLLPTLKKLGLE